jgi:hypothetical protein
MKIDLFIFDQTKEPIKKHYRGSWCLEKMIEDLLDEYYGGKIKSKVMDLLRERLKKVGEIENET